MKLLTFFENIFDRILGLFIALACILLALVTTSVCLEVVMRYFFNRSQVWVIELSEYSLLYITFLGVAWVLKSDSHVRVDLFTTSLSARGRAICSLISFMICLVVSVVLTVYGIRVTWDHFSEGIYNPTILEFPKSAILLIIPLGGITLLIQSLRGARDSAGLLQRVDENGDFRPENQMSL
jgi:TRAP-type C4-dicarboxylate transport system permease small subunit